MPTCPPQTSQQTKPNFTNQHLNAPDRQMINDINSLNRTGANQNQNEQKIFLIQMEAKRRTARTLVHRLSSISEQTRTAAISELRLLSKHEPEIRSFIADAGAVPCLAETLYSSSPAAQENAVATLLNLSISDRKLLMSTRGLLDALSHLLRQRSATAGAVQAAAATLYSLLVADEFRPIIGAKRDIVFALIDIIRNPNSAPRSIKDALKAMFGIALYPLNRAAMIELGAAPALFGLVVNDGRVGVMEDATAVISQVAGCGESVEAFRKVAGLRVLGDLLDPATGSSVRVRENAVSALLNLVQCGGEEVAEEVRRMSLGVIDEIMEIAENGSSVKAKSKANSLLNVLSGGEGRIGNLRFEFVLDDDSSS